MVKIFWTVGGKSNVTTGRILRERDNSISILERGQVPWMPTLIFKQFITKIEGK